MPPLLTRGRVTLQCDFGIFEDRSLHFHICRVLRQGIFIDRCIKACDQFALR